MEGRETLSSIEVRFPVRNGLSRFTEDATGKEVSHPPPSACSKADERERNFCGADGTRLLGIQQILLTVEDVRCP